MRLNTTNTQTLVNDQVVVNDTVCGAVLARRASGHRYLGAGAFHRGPSCSEQSSLREGRLGSKRRPKPAATSKTMPSMAAVGLPGPIWATLVINRAVA